MDQSTKGDPSAGTAELGYLDLGSCQAALSSGALTSAELVEALIRRVEAIDRSGPMLRSVIAIDDRAIDIARARDEERRGGTSGGPLHGVPVLVKDNLDTAGGLATTAGSLALADPACQPDRDAAAVTRLREAGAIVIGKANLSEWANFRSGHSSSGWSAVGGQCLNPHVLDRSPGGSSSGSGAAVAAGFAPLAVGTETDGSILCPAIFCGAVGLKPTVGYVSTAGVVPISSSQDTVGTLARSVADAAALLEVLADPNTAAQRALSAAPSGTGVTGLRIGVPRKVCFGYSSWADAAVVSVLGRLADAGAVIVDPAEIDTLEGLYESEDELAVLFHEFKASIDAYLTARPGPTEACPRSLAELIRFDEDHHDVELGIFGQEIFEAAQATEGLEAVAYLEALARGRKMAGEDGIDATLARHELDALVAPTMAPAWTIDHVNGDRGGLACYKASAVAGYPAVSVPVGDVAGLPLGLCVMGGAWSEPTLIRIASVIEELAGASPRPGFLERAML